VLNDTFGQCALPKVSWQIDPFGHSREFASLMALAGFDGLFVARIDHQDKRRRLVDKEMEMVFRGNDDIGEASDLLFGVLHNHYSAPSGFCYDVLCSDDPLNDDPMSPDNNVASSVCVFVKFPFVYI
jgi:lysosomal alpha-mannosidase